MQPALILASTSRYRREQLARLGVAFDSVAPACDEEALKRPDLAPRELAESLADAKALSLAGRHPRAAIIGGDQVATIDGRVLGKPGDVDAAIAQLALLSGRTHELITAISVWHDGQLRRHTDVTRLTMRALDRAALARYVAADRPLDCAGSYKLERAGIALFTRIESADHSAIVGLPLIALTAILVELGFAIP